MSRDRRSAGYLLAFLSAATGALRYNLAVYAHPHGFSYEAFLAFALLVGVVCSAAHVLARDGWRGIVPGRGRWRHALAYALLMAWGTLAHFVSLRYLNETVMSSLAQTNILLVIGLAVWLLGERFTRREWLAVVVILAGMFAFRPWSGVHAKGFLILLSGLFTAALATIVAKRRVADIPPRVLMLWRNVAALAVAGAYSLTLERPTITLATGLACVATGILGPYLHGLFFLQALERIDAAKASLLNRIQPAVVFTVSWALLDRLPARNEILSAALLVAGTIWLVRARPAAPRAR